LAGGGGFAFGRAETSGKFFAEAVDRLVALFPLGLFDANEKIGLVFKWLSDD
jgi:hypothetical protein